MLNELKVQHRNIVQLAFNGFKREEIAEQLEITTTTVSNVLNSPLGKAYMNGLSDKVKEATIDVRKELVSMNKDALAALKDLLTPKAKIPASVKLSAAKDVLDRTGFKPTDKINIDMTLQSKTDAEIDAEIEALEDSITQGTQHQVAEPVESPESPSLEEPIQATESPTLNAPDTLDVPNNLASQATVTVTRDVQPGDAEVQTIIDNTSFDPFKNIETKE